MSFLAISKELLDESGKYKFEYVLSHRLNQDHLENFFSKVRSRSGHNNNPNVLQFTSSLKRLLVHQHMTASQTSNCIEIDEGSMVFQARIRKRSGDDCELELLPAEVGDVAEYIGGFVLKTLQVSCSSCLEGLFPADPTRFSNDHVYNTNKSLIEVKNRGGLKIPSSFVRHVCIIAEKTLRYNLKINNLNKTIFPTTVGQALSTILNHVIFRSFTCADHATSMVRTLSKTYIKIRLFHETKKSLEISERACHSRLVIVKNM